MKNNYRKIEFQPGIKIKEVVEKLQECNNKNEKVFTEFNDKIFYSDTVTLEDAYLQLTGMTKEEFEKFKDIEMEKAEERREFIKYFGYNQKLYLDLLPLKKDGELSWKEIYENFKWGNIDLENGTINVPVKTKSATIQWFKPDVDEEQSNSQNTMVKIIETNGVCEFCGSTKDVCEIKVDVPDDFENIDARGQKAHLMMCDDCMDKIAQAFIEKHSGKETIVNKNQTE